MPKKLFVRFGGIVQNIRVGLDKSLLELVVDCKINHIF
jgi:hypothetical protein